MLWITQARAGLIAEYSLHKLSFLFPAQRSYELMLQRALERKTFGKYLWEHGGTQE
jgi:alkylation response protein AidB-like acyl-CoA dehydrogenase